MTNLDSMLKSMRHHFAKKDLYNESYSLSSSHVRMWELNHKENWVPKNWCFQTVVLEKSLESPLDCKEIKPINLKWNQPWIFSGRTDAEVEAQKLWPSDAKSQLIGKDWRQEEKGTTEDEMAGWHHGLNGHELELCEVKDREAWHAAVHGIAESDTTVWLNNNTTTCMCKTNKTTKPN